MKKKKRRLKIKNLIIILVIIVALIFSFCFYRAYVRKNENEKRFLGSDTLTVSLYNENLESVKEIIRGEEVIIYPNQELEEEYIKVIYDEVEYYANKNNLVNSLNDVVFEKEVYVRTSYNLNKEPDSIELLDLVEKGSKLEIIGYDTLLSDGNVLMYKVKTEAGSEGYFYQKYTVKDKETSLLNYDADGVYKTHSTRKDIYGGGDGASLDYYPVEKVTFENNKMPENVYSLYLNGTKGVISKVDDYIEYAKTTKINAFVVDIKDSGVSAYASNVMKEYSKTSYDKALNTFDSYKSAIKKIKDAGFYVIGRITTFKDTYYITDNKSDAISDKSNNPLKHQSSYWPSAYNRDVWEYNIALAKEAVLEMGFNEIQFDYVRFPDGLRTKEKQGTVDYKNTYNETKAQAIQRFLMYATNELHKLNVYVSCDVFGESSWGYVTSYGQYWPAMSNVVDVISAMPYTDHFGNSYGGHTNPWEYPYDTMLTWANTASERQKETPTPAIARTWITAYNTPYWNPTVNYNGDELSSQINALYKKGLNGGYMTWLSSSNLTKYKYQKSAFTKEYQ